MPLELPDARQLSDEALQVLRLRALRGIELGYSELELAELLGVCHETISRWWTAYRADGLDALPGGRTGRPLGSGRFLSDQQAQRISTVTVIPFDLSSAVADACVLSNGRSVLPQSAVNAGSRCDACTPNVSYPNAVPTAPPSGIATASASTPVSIFFPRRVSTVRNHVAVNASVW